MGYTPLVLAQHAMLIIAITSAVALEMTVVNAATTSSSTSSITYTKVSSIRGRSSSNVQETHPLTKRRLQPPQYVGFGEYAGTPSSSKDQKGAGSGSKAASSGPPPNSNVNTGGSFNADSSSSWAAEPFPYQQDVPPTQSDGAGSVSTGSSGTGSFTADSSSSWAAEPFPYPPTQSDGAGSVSKGSSSSSSESFAADSSSSWAAEPFPYQQVVPPMPEQDYYDTYYPDSNKSPSSSDYSQAASETLESQTTAGNNNDDFQSFSSEGYQQASVPPPLDNLPPVGDSDGGDFYYPMVPEDVIPIPGNADNYYYYGSQIGLGPPGSGGGGGSGSGTSGGSPSDYYYYYGRSPPNDFYYYYYGRGKGTGGGKGKGGGTWPLPSPPSDDHYYYNNGKGKGGGTWPLPSPPSDDHYYYYNGGGGGKGNGKGGTGSSTASCSVPYTGGPIEENMFLDQNYCLHYLPPTPDLPTMETTIVPSLEVPSLETFPPAEGTLSSAGEFQKELPFEYDFDTSLDAQVMADEPTIEPTPTPSVAPTTEAPTTLSPTTETPTTLAPTTETPTTLSPTTATPTTLAPTTATPTTLAPTTAAPTTATSTQAVSTVDPSTVEPSTVEPSTEEPSTEEPSTLEPSASDAPTAAPNTTNTLTSEMESEQSLVDSTKKTNKPTKSSSEFQKQDNPGQNKSEGQQEKGVTWNGKSKSMPPSSSPLTSSPTKKPHSSPEFQKQDNSGQNESEGQQEKGVTSNGKFKSMSSSSSPSTSSPTKKPNSASKAGENITSTPFLVEYSFNVRDLYKPSNENMDRVAVLTLDYLRLFFEDYYNKDQNSSLLDFTGRHIRPEISGGASDGRDAAADDESVRIGFEVTATFSKQANVMPGEAGVNEVVETALSEPAVSSLIMQLPSMGADNPLSFTDSITYYSAQLPSSSTNASDGEIVGSSSNSSSSSSSSANQEKEHVGASSPTESSKMDARVVGGLASVAVTLIAFVSCMAVRRHEKGKLLRKNHQQQLDQEDTFNNTKGLAMMSPSSTSWNSSEGATCTRASTPSTGGRTVYSSSTGKGNSYRYSSDERQEGGHELVVRSQGVPTNVFDRVYQDISPTESIDSLSLLEEANSID